MPRSSIRRAMVAAGAAPVLALTLSSPSFGAIAEPGPSPTRSFTASPLTPTDVVSANKAPSSRLARTPQQLLKRTDSARVNVMIKYDYDATASYTGGVRSLAATSPSVTKRKLTGKSAAEKAYGAYQSAQERTISAAVRRAAPSATIGQSFQVVYGGVAASVPAKSIKDIVKVDGVVAVLPDDLQHPLTDASSDFINATALQNTLGGAAGPANAGKGILYGNLDTGVWPEHASFADQGNLSARPGPALMCNFGDNPLTPAVDVFNCNKKLIGGRPFLETYLSDGARAAAEPYHTARDSGGHGTHTSSTTAGNVLASAPVFGVNRGPVRGIAPGAWLAEYKVCGIQGCYQSDSTAAVQQAVADGVDVINFSISGGSDPYSDPVELAFLDAYAAGVFVAASAGNSGPSAATANHLSPWVTSVAASTQKREFATTLHLAAAGGSPALALDGASITAGSGAAPLPIVRASAAPYSDARCTSPAPAGLFTGKIVACQRGGNGRVEKGYNVKQGGAAAMVLYNPTLADVETDNHWLPTVHLADGTALLAFLAANPGATAQFAAGEKRNGQGDVMAAFSSRGPGGTYLKPDVTAPGVQILAGQTPTPDEISGGPAGEYFQAIAGTSMSSPHVAGAAALVMAAHPTWTPGQVKSALMTSATTNVVKEDLATLADPFDMGAGRINVGAAAAVTLTLDESAANFAALGAEDITGVHLNLPSVNAPTMPGAITTKRTVKNVSSVKQSISVAGSTTSDSKVKVSPAQFKLNPGESRSVTINISSESPIGSQRFGKIVFTPSSGAALHLPVAFVHKQSAVSVTQSCTPTTIALGAKSTCTVTATNGSPVSADVTLNTTLNQQLTVGAASAPAVVTGTRSVRATATLAPEAPGTPAIGPGSLYGYLPLDAFGVVPEAIGDEDVLNFNVPSFAYAGRSWSQLGVDSNGYVIVGGGTSEDNNCCNLPAGPSPARPNNVLAPFWTDLDGTGAPGIFVATLTDGVDTWIVVEHRANVFGTSSLRTFQTWIGINGTEDITYAYDPANLPADPAGQSFLVGAENILGEGQFLPVGTLPTEDLRVTSSPGAPPGSLTYTVDVVGAAKGTGVVETRMTAPTVLGTTIVRSQVGVS
ncbi:S8 family serine peptidase [Knoellia sp. CPCC 206453]|uniref:S8 family serine peptidase n=1 Tax=Knoellia pratensis TaxID=3404796 RepID=UPI003613697F